ncbi:UNVERIFIED_CONTAM: hypothetical protein Sangu_2041700 [Sesamum angustifolium]|uniref:Uncharacterized protein n=1 Tax=Sesamum angustifolium TaxID=2727405 RepID=A0AAW2LHW4_9LAMI
MSSKSEVIFIFSTKVSKGFQTVRTNIPNNRNIWFRTRRLLLLAVVTYIVGHHLLELLETHVPVPIGINGLDHPGAVLDGAVLPEAQKGLLELRRRDLAVVVLVVELERLSQLLLSRMVGVRIGAAEGGELLEVDVAVLVGVNLPIIRATSSGELSDPRAFNTPPSSPGEIFPSLLVSKRSKTFCTSAISSRYMEGVEV